MKTQHMAVIFIIIILPISLILSEYVQNQVETIKLQISYDTKLSNATYDAIRAFQLNTVNSSTSDLTNSKLRDLEASINTFYNSISSNFNLAGYNRDQLRDYVPALVYTLYDGYYIYTPFHNHLSDDPKTNDESKFINDATYKEDNERIEGLRPYVYYSCRYKKGSTLDVVITYALDNYVTIQGTAADGRNVNIAGYVLDNVELIGGNIRYRNISIPNSEVLTEYIGNQLYEYIKINGVKYYKDTDGSYFTLLNGKKIVENGATFNENDSAKRYYLEALELKQKIMDYGLDVLTPDDAVDTNSAGNIVSISSILGGGADNYFLNTGKIFDYNNDIEEPDSNFNSHRLSVIRYSIEKNLSIAIANYNYYSDSSSTDFQMPTLKEDEWDKLLNNVSMISFMQGLNIGGKIYNGYAIVNNNKNEEVVTENSIYITTNDGIYHSVRENNLNNVLNAETTVNGVFNVDFERKSVYDDEGVTNYYYPKRQLASYDSIITQSGIDNYTNIYDYLQGKDKLAQIYYTALARERYSTYKVFRLGTTFKDSFK